MIFGLFDSTVVAVGDPIDDHIGMTADEKNFEDASDITSIVSSEPCLNHMMCRRLQYLAHLAIDLSICLITIVLGGVMVFITHYFFIVEVRRKGVSKLTPREKCPPKWLKMWLEIAGQRTLA